MNKGELVAKIAEDAEISKAQATAALNAFINAVGEALKNGDSVSLVGFGKFSVTERAARQGFNSLTKKPMDIAAKKSAKFKAGKELNDMIA